MNEFIKWLSANQLTSIVLIIFVLLLATSLAVLYIVAFFQGRKVYFWPPKIGPKPEDKHQMRTSFDAKEPGGSKSNSLSSATSSILPKNPPEGLVILIPKANTGYSKV